MTHDLVSRPYQPGSKCCERCVFGRGPHAEFCWPCPNPLCDGRIDLTEQEKQAFGSAKCNKCSISFDTTRRSIKCIHEGCTGTRAANLLHCQRCLVGLPLRQLEEDLGRHNGSPAIFVRANSAYFSVGELEPGRVIPLEMTPPDHDARFEDGAGI